MKDFDLNGLKNMSLKDLHHELDLEYDSEFMEEILEFIPSAQDL